MNEKLENWKNKYLINITENITDEIVFICQQNMGKTIIPPAWEMYFERDLKIRLSKELNKKVNKKRIKRINRR